MRTVRIALLALAFILPVVVAAPAATAQAGFEGRVFIDADANGAFDPGETPLSGVVATNGEHRVRSDPSGRVRIPESGDGFVRITRPRGVDCHPWYRRSSGDFACRRIADPDDLFFVHISDAHAFADPQDFVEFSLPRTPSWVPGFVERRLFLYVLRRFNPRLSPVEIANALRSGLPEAHRDIDDTRLLPALREEFLRPGSESGRVREHLARAFDEVASLAPEFVISTGDLILEGNRATPDAARRWMTVYREEVERTGLPFFQTIGNNELVASSRGEQFAKDPDSGKGLYERHFGPTTYGFERGAVHFEATDTHMRHRGDWRFVRLSAQKRRALEVELGARPERAIAVLNHEPFGWDPDDEMDAPLARDEGLLARAGVDYALTGHIHRNGIWHDGVTTHVSTGALSGMRWYLPADFVERGMRLFWMQGERLFSAWKHLGEPSVGFVSPGHGAPLWPSGAERARPGEIVFVAVDRSGPFEHVELLADGEPVPFERWGRYFGAASRSTEVAHYAVVARRADGSEERATLAASPPTQAQPGDQR